MTGLQEDCKKEDAPLTSITSSTTTDDTEDEFLAHQEAAASLASHVDMAHKGRLLYSINDTPPWYICLVLGFQHFMMMFGSAITLPMILAPALCIKDPLYTSELIATGTFVAGIITILQLVIGVRLPVIQGGTFSYLLPSFAILSLPQWRCHSTPMNHNMTVSNMTNMTLDFTSDVQSDVTWMSRMCEIQGAITIASLAQVAIGGSGLLGYLLRFIGPNVIAPTVGLIGISLFKSAAKFCAKNWIIAAMTIFLIILFSQYLDGFKVPFPVFNRKKKKCGFKKFPVFTLFPILLAVLVSWAICGILTVSNGFPNDETHWTYEARTDTKLHVISKAQWFRVPYPGQWGWPTISFAAVAGMMSAVIAGMLDSIGDYYACARLSGAKPPPVSAMNRGILIEGIGCMIAGIFGSGTGSTSYSENVGVIGITRVGSRRVVLYAGGIMIVFGIIGKIGAVFVTLPDPIVGGVFVVMFGMIASVGISNLQFVDMNSPRNLFIFGFSMLFGLALPQWMSANLNAINTGHELVDQILTVLLSTSMFVGGVVSCVLDNTIPGTDEERGLTVWAQTPQDEASDEKPGADGQKLSRSPDETYDLPLCMSCLDKCTLSKYIPFCPQFQGSCRCPGRCSRNLDTLPVKIEVDNGYLTNGHGC